MLSVHGELELLYSVTTYQEACPEYVPTNVANQDVYFHFACTVHTFSYANCKTICECIIKFQIASI